MVSRKPRAISASHARLAARPGYKPYMVVEMNLECVEDCLAAIAEYRNILKSSARMSSKDLATNARLNKLTEKLTDALLYKD